MCEGGVDAAGSPACISPHSRLTSRFPTHRWPALLAGCQPRVSWSMLVKRTLIWVWQGNQQPNSTVKLNSVVEHRSASFYAKAAERESAATSICHWELQRWALPATTHRKQREMLSCLQLHPNKSWIHFRGVSRLSPGRGGGRKRGRVIIRSRQISFFHLLLEDPKHLNKTCADRFTLPT